MTLVNPETTEVGRKTTDQVEQETRKKLDEAKADVLKKMSVPELIKGFLRDYAKMSSTERWQYLSAIAVALLFKKKTDADQQEGGTVPVGTNKTNEVVQPEQEAEETQEPQPDAKKTPNAPADSGPALPKVDLEKYRKGDVISAIIGLYPGIEIQGKAQPVKTSISKNNGVPKWTKKSTDDWDYTAAGNTDEGIEKGEYRIQAAVAPDGYTRGGTDQVPASTQKKLIRIAELLRADPRMPLFTGIAMTVDGVQVMMVKEIHIHSMSEHGKRNLSDYYYQPHTGVSYIMKKTA